jgi:uncharacterized protein YlaI
MPKNYTESCEICNETNIILDKHHIISQSEGGTNEPSNIAHICPNCHRRIHMSQIILEGRFLTSDGYQLIYHWNDEEDIIERENPSVYIMGF